MIMDFVVGLVFLGWCKFLCEGGKKFLFEFIYILYVRNGVFGLWFMKFLDKIYVLFGIVVDVVELGIYIDYIKIFDEVFE